ncbi:zinc-binding dehydrogenase [Klebsiella grimontii]|uniref:zinc-binding dehydrogenase n=3 Tax=Klebsiella TaxID=570 RepID=UPI0011454A24|nr:MULTISPECIES: zinc-binding dehydrogenase [Klebsiella]KAA0493368.1 zinc-binding dehydrogenase [Klebsiella grimontii]
MKAAGYDVQGAPGVLKYVDIPDPVAEPDDVLISVEAISIEGGSDQPPFDAASLSSWVVGYAAAGSLTVDLWSPMQSNQTLMGVFIGPLFERHGVRTRVDDMLQAVAAGRIRGVIDRIFPQANAAAAHKFAETAKSLGRIVMKP